MHTTFVRTFIAVTAALLLAGSATSAQAKEHLRSLTPSNGLSTVRVSATSVAVSSSVTVTLTARNRFGQILYNGGLTVTFSTSGGTSTGTFGPVKDNSDGTYTAPFTGVTAGTASTINAIISGLALVSSLPSVTVTAVPKSTGSSTSPPATNPTGSTTGTTSTTGSTGGTTTGTTSTTGSTGGTTTGTTSTTDSTGGTTTGTTSTTDSTGGTTTGTTSTTDSTGGTTTGTTSTTGSTGGTTTGTTSTTGSTGSSTTGSTTSGAGTNVAFPPATPGSGATGYSLTPPAQDANGWTIYPALQSGQNIYVSSSGGNDSNNGLTTATAVATIAHGFSLLRSGYGDHLLLKCGDSFTEVIPRFLDNLGGASNTDPMIIGSYGTGARPVLVSYFLAAGGGDEIDLSPRSPTATVTHLWFLDLDLYDSARDPSAPSYNPTTSPLSQDAGINIYSGYLSDIHVENCRFRFYMNNICIQASNGQANDIRIRRCQILDAWFASSAHSQGLIGGGTNLLIEDNLFDHDGWNATASTGTATMFNHAIYINASNNVTLHNNILSNASNFGIKLIAYAPGTSNNVFINGNVILGCPNAMSLAADSGYNTSNLTVSANVLTEIGGTLGGVAQSVGMYAQDLNTALITGNYFVNKQSIGSAAELCINAAPIKNFTFTGNTIFAWGGEDGTGSGIVNSGTPETNCVISQNNINFGATAYTNATCTMETYDTSVGGPGTSADFIQQARSQTKATWNTQLTGAAVVAYFTSGFQVVLGD